jgi:flagella basal body P-ring formation protein FlgA
MAQDTPSAGPATAVTDPFTTMEEAPPTATPELPLPPPPPVAPAPTVPADFHQQVEASLQQWAQALRASHPGLRLDPQWQRVDPRLKLATCSHLPLTRQTGNRVVGRSSVRLSCTAPAWSLNVSVSVKGYRHVVVTQLPLERGEPLQASGLVLEEREVNDSSGGHFDTVASLEGYTARRSIPRGKALTRTMLEAPRLVRKGQVVVIEAGTAAFSVRTDGTALTDGGLGDIIKVKNNQSGRIVEGTVAGEGRVNVPL